MNYIKNIFGAAPWRATPVLKMERSDLAERWARITICGIIIIMNKVKWIIFIIVVLGIFGVLILTNNRDGDDFKGDATKIINEGPIKDRVYGSADQKVILIEYGDFQCPACGKLYPAVKEIKDTYKDKLTFIFRNLPLTNIHPNALAAATAAEAAGQQGKFFEMHDQLYENQQAWQSAGVNERSGFFEQYASSVGLNLDQFKKDLTNSDISDKIKRDRAMAKTFNANSTPTFILNGQVLPETASVNPEELKKAVIKALEDAGYNLEEPKT